MSVVKSNQAHILSALMRMHNGTDKETLESIFGMSLSLTIEALGYMM